MLYNNYHNKHILSKQRKTFKYKWELEKIFVLLKNINGKWDESHVQIVIFFMEIISKLISIIMDKMFYFFLV